LATVKCRVNVLGVRIVEDRAGVAVGHGSVLQSRPINGLLGANHYHADHDRTHDDNGCDDAASDVASQSQTASGGAIDAVEAVGALAVRVAVGISGADAVRCRAVVGAHAGCHLHREGRTGVGRTSRARASGLTGAVAAPVASKRRVQAEFAGSNRSALISRGLLAAVRASVDDAVDGGALTLSAVAHALAVAVDGSAGQR